jgi:tRNA-dihydrouridine synthase B
VTLVLAPMRGITGRAFRCAFARHFTGLDLAVSPFVPTVRGDRVKPSHLRDLQPVAGFPDLPLVPQVIGKDPGDFARMIRELLDNGFDAVDLNAGCPWKMVVRKGRGAGLLEDADALRRMLDAGCSVAPGRLSIKVRLGIRSADTLPARMDLLNGYPLRIVTIHPRTARQMYEGSVDLDAFEACAAACRHPVAYNGDIRTPSGLRSLRERFPFVAAWMIGRGVAANPFLPEEIRGKTARRDFARLQAFLEDFVELTKHEVPGPSGVLGRLKELWSHLSASIPGGGRLWQGIRLCRTMAEYESVIAPWFARETARLVEPAAPPASRCESTEARADVAPDRQ